jgi:hypothetical protein
MKSPEIITFSGLIILGLFIEISYFYFFLNGTPILTWLSVNPRALIVSS